MVDRFEIGKGLDVPISGEPQQQIDSKDVDQVGLVADDYIGMRPTLLVSEGDRIQAGQPIFSDKKTEGVVFTSPVSGQVAAIHRGAKRRFLSFVIKCNHEAGRSFAKYDSGQLSKLSREDVVSQLVDAGLWTALRTRPYSRVPSPKGVPQAVFVNAMDSNPLAAAPGPIIAERREEFSAGVEILSRLTEGPVFVCRPPSSDVPGEKLAGTRVAEFDGPHPAGLAGTHMHYLKPAGVGRVNWYLNYQDAIAIGHLFLAGQLDAGRVISLAGPKVSRPRLLKTQIGASLAELTTGELSGPNTRVVSGSVLCGRTCQDPTGYLGRYHLQVSCLEEGNQREFLGWQMPGFDKFSVTRAFAAAWQGPKKFALNTSTGGSERAMVPIGTYEKVMPLDLMPTPLLRSLICRDTATAQELGCLELDEEDLGLCTFVCPGKYEYGEILRDNLLKIEKEG
ncbi:MAG: Na(+)-translocating NADH-quinone reductase subunit A [Planctomycetales bacterium]|nr:Na(+)-translocating NADH-quinone reductase subunit A [Planctomycetales bacterium]